VIAGGVQNMNAIRSRRMYAGQTYGFETPFSGSPGWTRRYGDEEVNTDLRGREDRATWDISRHDMEVFAAESNRRAAAAIDEGRFSPEIVPVATSRWTRCVRRAPRSRDCRLKTVARGRPDHRRHLQARFRTAAAAVLIAFRAGIEDHGLKPPRVSTHLTVARDSPIMMLTAPIPATRHALAKTGLKLDDIDLVEINEAFRKRPCWPGPRKLDADLSRVNVNGGAIALGHPLGATGAKLMTTLLLRARAAERPLRLQTMCEGGGLANVTIIERL